MLKNTYKFVAGLTLSFFVTTASFAQNKVVGKVIDAESSYGLEGAAVLVSGTTIGTSTNEDGEFSLDIPKSNFTLEFSYSGYSTISKTVSFEGSDIDLGSIGLVYGESSLSGVEVIASRSTNKTPFTSTTISKKEIVQNLGSRDVPNVLNVTPSVYSTNQGSGAGDSRINMRGFDQRNISIMINGVPANDNENGWLFWSNYDGLGDAISSIEVQRGISPVNQSVPSVGGTVNIITDPASKEKGIAIQREAGSWNFQKTVISANTGLINDKFAVNALLSRKTGDGFAEGTFTDAWAWYVGASYQATEKDRFEFYALSARQHHGQNLYAQNIARYSKSYALGLDDYDIAALDKYKEGGRDFNQNYNGVSSNYNGEQYYEFYKKHRGTRMHRNFLMERHNFFQRPHVNFNYTRDFSENVKWNNTVYFIGGAGGGTGTWGSVKTDRSYAGMGLRQWDAEIAENSNNIDPQYSNTLNRSTGVLRNSVNQQRTFGAISKIDIAVNDNLDLQFGIDWRSTVRDGWKEIRDLLGGDYYVDQSSDFDVESGAVMKGLAGRVDYDFTNTVDWFGAFGQLQYSKDGLNIFAMGGSTVNNFSHENYMKKGTDGKAFFAETDNYSGFQTKAGIKYEVSRNFSIYANGGYISKNPIFDFAINDRNGLVYDDPENEKVTTFELGANLYSGNNFGVQLNAYYTAWEDRTVTRGINNQDGSDGVVFISGLGQNHSGIELNGSWKASNSIRFDFGGSLGNWEYAGDVNATYTDYNAGAAEDKEYNLYLDGLKVGDAPQTSGFVSVTATPIKELSVKLDYRGYTDFYSDFSATGRTDANDRVQSWEIPSYGVTDLHVFYNVPTKSNSFSVTLFAHIFNLFDNLYIQDAEDNSRYNAFDRDHDADDAEVFFGMPRNFNSGIRVNF